MPHRSFSSPTRAEAVTFDLNGRSYDCIRALPGGFFIDVRLGHVPAQSFFDVVLAEGDKADFAAAIRATEEPIVDQTTLDAIQAYLIEVYTGRPTGRSSDSSNGATTTGAGSTASP